MYGTCSKGPGTAAQQSFAEPRVQGFTEGLGCQDKSWPNAQGPDDATFASLCPERFRYPQSLQLAQAGSCSCRSQGLTMTVFGYLRLGCHSGLPHERSVCRWAGHRKFQRSPLPSARGKLCTGKRKNRGTGPGMCIDRSPYTRKQKRKHASTI